jgi:PPOX class probable FMN-dependent enzyme
MAGNGGSRFENVIRDEAGLRAIMGSANERAGNKVIDRVDRHAADFIARAPFLVIASTDADGVVDLSPKGDPAGFVAMLDETTLAIPDRPGNRRADTFSNVLKDPRVGLIFLIPGKRETLRVSGRAEIVADSDLLARLEAHGKLPALALVVHVERVMFHCSKCMIRSHMWEPEQWPSLEGLASLGEVIRDHSRLAAPVADLDRIIERDTRERLY